MPFVKETADQGAGLALLQKGLSACYFHEVQPFQSDAVYDLFQGHFGPFTVRIPCIAIIAAQVAAGEAYESAWYPRKTGLALDARKYLADLHLASASRCRRVPFAFSSLTTAFA